MANRSWLLDDDALERITPEYNTYIANFGEMNLAMCHVISFVILNIATEAYDISPNNSVIKQHLMPSGIDVMKSIRSLGILEGALQIAHLAFYSEDESIDETFELESNRNTIGQPLHTFSTGSRVKNATDPWKFKIICFLKELLRGKRMSALRAQTV